MHGCNKIQVCCIGDGCSKHVGKPPVKGGMKEIVLSWKLSERIKVKATVGLTFNNKHLNKDPQANKAHNNAAR